MCVYVNVSCIHVNIFIYVYVYPMCVFEDIKQHPAHVRRHLEAKRSEAALLCMCMCLNTYINVSPYVQICVYMYMYLHLEAKRSEATLVGNGEGAADDHFARACGRDGVQESVHVADDWQELGLHVQDAFQPRRRLRHRTTGVPAMCFYIHVSVHTYM